MYQQQPPPLVTFRNTMNVGTVVVRAFAVTIEVFIHAKFGARYIGFQAVAAVPLIFIFAMFWQGHDIGPLMNFLMLFVVMAIAQWLEAMRNQKRGNVAHTRYSGYPCLLFRSKPHLEGAVKHIVEPVLTAAGGVLAMDWNRPLGMYFVVAALCLYISNSMVKAIEAREAMDLQDAIAEQRFKTRHFDQLRGRRWTIPFSILKEFCHGKDR